MFFVESCPKTISCERKIDIIILFITFYFCGNTLWTIIWRLDKNFEKNVFSYLHPLLHNFNAHIKTDFIWTIGMKFQHRALCRKRFIVCFLLEAHCYSNKTKDITNLHSRNTRNIIKLHLWGIRIWKGALPMVLVSEFRFFAMIYDIVS